MRSCAGSSTLATVTQWLWPRCCLSGITTKGLVRSIPEISWSRVGQQCWETLRQESPKIPATRLNIAKHAGSIDREKDSREFRGPDRRLHSLSVVLYGLSSVPRRRVQSPVTNQERRAPENGHKPPGHKAPGQKPADQKPPGQKPPSPFRLHRTNERSNQIIYYLFIYTFDR